MGSCVGVRGVLCVMWCVIKIPKTFFKNGYIYVLKITVVVKNSTIFHI